jgi:hypothetical protein
MYLIRSVIYNKVQDDPHPSCMRFRNKPLHVLNSAIRRVHILVVRNVVSHVHLRRIVHGADPNGINADGSDVVEFGNDAIKIANAIAVGVFEAGGVDLVDDAVLPPLALGDRHCCNGQRMLEANNIMGKSEGWKEMMSETRWFAGGLHLPLYLEQPWL